MTKPLATLLVGLGLVVASACGRRGPLELPPGRAPMPVEALTAIPGEGSVLLRWTNPVKEISGRPLGELEAVEIWVFDGGLPTGGQAVAADTVERTARLVRRILRQDFGTFRVKPGEGPGSMAFPYAVDARQAGPSKLAFTVRVIDRRRRASDFSAPVTVELARKEAPIDRPAPDVVS